MLNELGYTVGFRVNGAFPGGVSEENITMVRKGNSVVKAQTDSSLLYVF